MSSLYFIIHLQIFIVKILFKNNCIRGYFQEESTMIISMNKYLNNFQLQSNLTFGILNRLTTHFNASAK